MKKPRTLKVKRMTSAIQKRLENFGFRILSVRFGTGFAVITYK